MYGQSLPPATFAHLPGVVSARLTWRYGHWLGAWVWAMLPVQLPAHSFMSLHDSPDLSQAAINKKVMKIFLFPP